MIPLMRNELANHQHKTCKFGLLYLQGILSNFFETFELICLEI